MARVRVAALLFVALLSFAGCSDLFEFNAFSALDTPPAPSLSDYQGSGGLAKLEADLSSPAIVALLKADPATTKQIEEYLLSTYHVTTFGDPDTATAQQRTAAALYADLYLKTTSGDQLVNAAVARIATDSSWNGDVKSLLSDLLPPGVVHDKAAFVAMMDGLLEAKDAYEQLGTSLASPGVPPAGMKMGDIAQKAVVSYVVGEIVTTVQSQSGLASDADAIDQLFLLASGRSNSIDSDSFTSAASSQSWLQNIFDAAGMKLQD